MSKALEEARKMEAAAIALRKELEEKEKEGKIQLCNVERGQRIVGESGRVYIVLKQMPEQEQTMAISDDFMAEDVMFDRDTADYKKSSIKEKIDNDILPNVEKDFGADNLIEHDVDLATVDMQKDFGTCKCKVRPITFDESREHNDLLVKEDLPDWYWTCTPWSTKKRGWSNSLAVVSPRGVIGDGGCSDYCGVRPVLYLKSNIFVSKGE